MLKEPPHNWQEFHPVDPKMLDYMYELSKVLTEVLVEQAREERAKLRI